MADKRTTPSKGRKALTLHLSPEELTRLESLLEEWQQVVPEAKWTMHKVAREALRLGVGQMERRARMLGQSASESEDIV